MVPNDPNWTHDATDRSPRSGWASLAANALWLLMATVMGVAIWIVPAETADPKTTVRETKETVPEKDPSVSPKAALAAIQLPPPPLPPDEAADTPAAVSKVSPPRTVKPLRAEPTSPARAKLVTSPAVTPMKPKPPSPTRNEASHRPKSKPATLKPLVSRVTERNLEPAPVVQTRIEPIHDAPKPALPEKQAPLKTIDAVADSDPRPAAPPVIQPAAETAKTGRVLLRMLEHGSGPRIEIAWPEREHRRERLFKLLQDCFGMRVAYLDDGGQLYVAEGARGEAWTPNVDRYSGFLRQPSGPVTDAEMRALRKISTYHAGRSVGSPVRLFSRRADAVLLGGLSHLAGEAYGAAKTVTARYAFDGGHFRITHVRIDGAAVPGIIDMTPLAPTCTRGI